MKLVRMMAGLVAVALSIQPLMSWAANSGSEKSQGSEKNVEITKPEKPEKGEKEQGKGTQRDGNPTCEAF